MLKAIETRYNGYRFRSRLEARWAVFFDSLGIRYEYEPEGFDLDGIWYLPDFWLPERKTWLEIKPDKPSGDDALKISAFAGALNSHLAVNIGDFDSADIPNFFVLTGPPAEYIPDSYTGQYRDGYDRLAPGWDNHHFWCMCASGRHAGIEFEGRGYRIQCGCRGQGDPGPRATGSTRYIEAAIGESRSARFE